MDGVPRFKKSQSKKKSTDRKAFKLGELGGLIHVTNEFSKEFIFKQLFLQHIETQSSIDLDIFLQDYIHWLPTMKFMRNGQRRKVNNVPPCSCSLFAPKCENMSHQKTLSRDLLLEEDQMIKESKNKMFAHKNFRN